MGIPVRRENKMKEWPLKGKPIGVRSGRHQHALFFASTAAMNAKRNQDLFPLCFEKLRPLEMVKISRRQPMITSHNHTQTSHWTTNVRFSSLCLFCCFVVVVSDLLLFFLFCFVFPISLARHKTEAKCVYGGGGRWEAPAFRTWTLNCLDVPDDGLQLRPPVELPQVIYKIYGEFWTQFRPLGVGATCWIV